MYPRTKRMPERTNELRSAGITRVGCMVTRVDAQTNP